MAADRLIDPAEHGTPDRIWSRWRSTLPDLPLTPVRHLVVVAPHPDDEVLGAGGFIALARSREVPVTLVAVTDGEASHPDSPTIRPRELAGVRIEESRGAAAELAAAPPRRVGLPDGGVTAEQETLTTALTCLLDQWPGPGTWCLATWRGDGHPDHEAVGHAAAAACLRTGARLLEYPVWMWQWATPTHPAVRRIRGHKLTLPHAARAAKHRAINHFTSQIRAASPHPADRPILAPHILRRFTGPTETYFA